MKLEHPVTLEQLQHIYDDAVEKVKRRRDHYANNKSMWRVGTRIVQTFSMLGLIIGIVAPLIDDWIKGYNGAEIGYVALALAGIVFAIDQIFVLSQTWMRYRNAELGLNTLLDEYSYKWLRMRISITDSASAHEKRDDCITLCEELVLGSRRIVEEETAKWNNQMVAAQQRFGSLMKEQKAIVEKLKSEDSIARKAERERALEQSSNGVAVKLIGFEKLQGAITANLGDQCEERGQPVKKIIFEDVPFGQHKLEIEAHYIENDRVLKWEDIVEVEKGKVLKVDVEV